MAVGKLGSQGKGTVVGADEQRAGTCPLCRWEEVDEEDPERHHPDLSTSVLLGPMALCFPQVISVTAIEHDIINGQC